MKRYKFYETSNRIQFNQAWNEASLVESDYGFFSKWRTSFSWHLPEPSVRFARSHLLIDESERIGHLAREDVQLETMAKYFDIQESIRYLLLILAQYISLDKQSQGFVHNLIGRERKEWSVSGYICRSMWLRFTHSEMVLKWAMRVTED